MNRLEERVADQEIDTAVWEGVRAVFERRHGSGTCPNDRLSDLKHANRDGETWQEYVVSARAAISAYISALESQGLKIVPVEPTEAMVKAVGGGYPPHWPAPGVDAKRDAAVMADNMVIVNRYRAMLNAVEG